METDLTIVMYHYVRDFAQTNWPRIKGLDIHAFRAQLDYLQKNANIVSFEALKAHLLAGEPLPPNPCWLTFDDGYKDHFDYVLPELVGRGVQASFFPTAKVVVERSLLAVNEIHYILASTENIDGIIAGIRRGVEEAHQQDPAARSFQAYWDEYAIPGRYDSREIIFVKRMLQVGMPSELREQVLDNLFHDYVTADFAAFADELYMTRDNLTELIGAGMHVGNHGYNHVWLNHLDAQGQAQEIDRALDVLDSLGARPDGAWVMCYPYGGYNSTTLDLLRERQCLLGLTIVPGTACLSLGNNLTLSRFDTNDLPQS